MRRYIREKKIASMALLAALLIVVTTAQAREFREVRDIASPTLAEDERAPRVIQPVDRKVVDEAVRMIFENYNTPAMEDMLADDFNDKTRVLDAIEGIPRDAIIRVRSVQGIQVYDQTFTPSPSGGPGIRTSIVSVTVDAQMEFTGADGQKERRIGVNELILRIHERITK